MGKPKITGWFQDMCKPIAAKKFIRESNAIERIHREPTQAEIDEYLRFIALDVVTVEELRGGPKKLDNELSYIL